MVTRCFSGGGNNVDKTKMDKLINVKYAHGIVMKSVTVNEDSTFAELKEAIARDSDVPVRFQRLLHRGRERGDHERLRVAGVRSNTKVILDDTAYRHARVRSSGSSDEAKQAEAQQAQVDSYRDEQRQRQQAGAAAASGGSRAGAGRGGNPKLNAVDTIRSDIDNVEELIVEFERRSTGCKTESILQELLTQQVLKLDGIDPCGVQEVRDARKKQVVRVHELSQRIERESSSRAASIVTSGDGGAAKTETPL